MSDSTPCPRYTDTSAYTGIPSGAPHSVAMSLGTDEYHGPNDHREVAPNNLLDKKGHWSSI